LEDYIYVPQRHLLIKKTEFESEMLDWNVTHYVLAQNGLIMPQIDVFMTHFVNLRDAAQGKLMLYDGNGSPVKREESRDIFELLTIGNSNGSFYQTHLDAQILCSVRTLFLR